jgi:hypothetical protein
MKRFLVFSVIALLIAGMVYAEPIKEQRNSSPRTAKERNGEDSSVKVDGVLKLEKGFVAVENADNVYIIPMLNRYIGFISDLREGAKVSVEGYEFKNMIRPTKVTIEGKSYDFMAWDRGRTSGFGKQDFRSDNNRRAPVPYGNNQRNGRRYGRGSCCFW